MSRPSKTTPLAAAFLLLAATTLSAQPAEEESDRQRPFYRVEAVVFTLAGGDSDAWPVDDLAGRATARDPAWAGFAREQALERARDEEAGEPSELQAALDAVDVIASLESGEESLTEALVYPEPWLALDTLSEPMDEAVQRLERSGAYAIRARLAWYQPLELSATGAAVRIHDEVVVAADWVSVTPYGRLLRDSRPVEEANELWPAFDYRLDGTIRLRQRQFMHADIDLAWRRPGTIGFASRPSIGAEGAFEVHRLEQSRTVRAERFEYFDSDWLGVLLRITPFQPEPGDEESEVASPGTDPA
ncbi:MAG: hypothetical protein GVY32_08800 [Gammaproteobacteria bacterium]|jgi:hypothetical protein|nr:hypothetical protein [Gammaproteobacteria bacterium]